MIVQVIIVGLATFRVSSLLIAERGPFAVFERLREIVGIRPRTELSESARLFSCIWCLSIWIAVPLWLLYYVAWWADGLLAAMTVTVISERWMR